MWLSCSPMGVRCWVLQCCNPMEYNLGRNMCLPVFGCSFHCFEQWGALCYPFSCPPVIQSIWLGTQLGRLNRVTQTLCPHYTVEKDLLFQIVFHPMTQSTSNLWWVLTLVWFLGIRLMNLHTPGHQSASLLDHIYPGLWAGC